MTIKERCRARGHTCHLANHAPKCVRQRKARAFTERLAKTSVPSRHYLHYYAQILTLFSTKC